MPRSIPANVGVNDIDATGTPSATTYLRGDGSWSTPSGGPGGGVNDGDVLASGLTFPNTGLHILDTNASHDLIIAPGSDLSADRTLTLTTGDADRTLTVSASTTLGGGTHSGTNTGDQTITLTGDVTGTGTGSFAATIANDAVTYAKLQNASAGNVAIARAASTSGDFSEVALAASNLLGRGSTGDIAAITMGNQVSISGTALDWSPNPLRMARWWTEGSSDGDFSTLSSGTSARSTNNSADSDATHPGTINGTTGTTTTGRNAHCYIEAGAIEFGTYAWRSVGCFKIPTLSDGTQTFSVMIGFCDSYTGVAYTDAACFRYQHSVNSGKFECVTASNSSLTAADSGVTAAADTWYSYEIRVNAAGSSVAFYINGSLVHTATATIPTGATRRLGYGHNILKSAGTTARTLVTDCCLVEGLITR